MRIPAHAQLDPPGSLLAGASSRLPGWMTRDRYLFGLALALRLGLALIWLHGRGARGGLELGTLADSIITGDGFVWHFYGTGGADMAAVPRASFFPPFYPYLLAAIKSLTGPAWLVTLQVLQALVGALLPLVVRRLAGHLLRADLAWWAALLAVLWPPCAVYAAEVFPVTFHAVGVPLVLLLVMRAAGSQRPLAAGVVAGVGYGLLAYSLPSFLGSLLMMPAGLRLSGLPWRRSLLIPAVTLGVALLVLSPWTVRNAVVQERFVPVATNLGFNFLGANNPHSRPHTNVLCAYDAIRWEVIDRTALATMNEADFDRLMLRQGLSYMVQHPGQTAGRMARRLLYYWWISPEMMRYNRLQGAGGMALMSIVTPLFIAGLMLSWRFHKTLPFGVLYAACGWVTVFYMNFAVRGRYSLGIHPVMLVLAVLGGAALLAWTRRYRAARPPTA